MKLRNFTKILIGFFAIVSLLCLLELSLSSMDTTRQLGITNMNEMFRSGVFTKDRVLFWKFSPGKIYTNPSTHYKGVLRINSIGFREREISKYKDTKTYRVFCLGGSNTCGEGVFENERFSNVVEKKLNELLSPLTFEVYNFGMPGYSTLQMLRLLENELV